METKQRGRPNICRGTKQRKQDFNSKLKAYSPTALDNVIKIAESSFSAETKLKANIFLIEKAVGKNYSVLEHDNKTEQNKQTHVTLQIIEPKRNIDISRIAGHADERTTIKNYLFDTNNEEETKKAILNALGDNPESSVTTTYRNAENENVTKRDSNIILFPSNKKAENPCFKRIFH